LIRLLSPLCPPNSPKTASAYVFALFCPSPVSDSDSDDDIDDDSGKLNIKIEDFNVIVID